MLQRPLLVALCASIGFVPSLCGQTGPELTARELFYSAVQPANQAAPKPEAPKPAALPAPKAPPKRPPATAVKTPPAALPAAPAAPETRPPAVSRPEPSALPGGARIYEAAAPVRTTAPAPSGGPALGLRYTILKRQGDSMVETAPDTVFHAGDRIQFAVQANAPGYLYIISQGSSGTWKPMFPSAEVENGDNHVEGLRNYTMPPGSRIVFDEQTGIEKVFIVLSRQPEPDLEKMIYSLQGPKTQPTSAPEPRTPPRTLMASASIDDRMVGQFRRAYARDLVIEKVDPSTSGEKKEYAVYVVNPTGSADSRVVADLQLVHQ